MPALRIILIALVVWIAWLLIKNALRKNQIKRETDSTQTAPRIVKCEVCGTHVPESEAIAANGKYYCSRAHRDQAG